MQEPTSPGPLQDSPTRVLLLSPFFHPEAISTGRYNTSLALGLAARGAQVTVACSHPLYPSWVPVPSGAQLDGMEIRRGGGHLRYPARPLLRRALLELWFAAYALRQAWRLRHRVDLVVAVLPPSLFCLALRLALPARVRRVGIVHDLQGVHAGASRSLAVRLLQGLINALEAASLRACGRLIVLSEAMKQEAVQSLRLEPARLDVCYPFVNLAPATPGARALQSCFAAGRFHLVYSGALGEKQNPAGLARVFTQILHDHPQVEVHVFSQGAQFERLKSLLSDSGAAERMHFRPLVDEADLPELYQRADAQVVPQADDTESGSLPSKLPNILASGRPILAICPASSEVAHIVERFRAGVCVYKWEPDEVSKALGKLLMQPSAEPADIARIRREFGLDKLVDTVLDTQDSCAEPRQKQ